MLSALELTLLNVIRRGATRTGASREELASVVALAVRQGHNTIAKALITWSERFGHAFDCAGPKTPDERTLLALVKAGLEAPSEHHDSIEALTEMGLRAVANSLSKCGPPGAPGPSGPSGVLLHQGHTYVHAGAYVEVVAALDRLLEAPLASDDPVFLEAVRQARKVADSAVIRAPER